ncbi:hypothetical protein [Alteraurantiacibacter palmitatis]|uniref:Uncharacterized protein n=1 Tax=Alteraurantiacibacter palmitatis TaxID=2054628 RepID=A0ABV7E1N7_9SPHN
MYEGKLPSAKQAIETGQDSGESGILREMTWRDLRARLDAVRDLRCALRRPGEAEKLASFDADSARRIAALSNGKQGVNLEDLADRKALGVITGASRDAGCGSDQRK